MIKETNGSNETVRLNLIWATFAVVLIICGSLLLAHHNSLSTHRDEAIRLARIEACGGAFDPTTCLLGVEGD